MPAMHGARKARMMLPGQDSRRDITGKPVSLYVRNQPGFDPEEGAFCPGCTPCIEAGTGNMLHDRACVFVARPNKED